MNDTFILTREQLTELFMKGVEQGNDEMANYDGFYSEPDTSRRESVLEEAIQILKAKHVR